MIKTHLLLRGKITHGGLSLSLGDASCKDSCLVEHWARERWFECLEQGDLVDSHDRL